MSGYLGGFVLDASLLAGVSFTVNHAPCNFDCLLSGLGMDFKFIPPWKQEGNFRLASIR